MPVQCKGRTLCEAAILRKHRRLLSATRTIEVQVSVIAESLGSLQLRNVKWVGGCELG